MAECEPFGDQFCCDAQRCLLVGFVLEAILHETAQLRHTPEQRGCRLAARPKRRNSVDKVDDNTFKIASTRQGPPYVT
jgi:hypothetical protein